MLSEPYFAIRQLRFTRQLDAAYAALRTTPPKSDDDAFEAALCLYQTGDIASALNVCRTAGWRGAWARGMAQALAAYAQDADAQAALPLARKAVQIAGAPPDAHAFYLQLLRATQTPGALDEADAHIARHLQQVPASESGLLAEMMDIAMDLCDPDAAYRHACALQSAHPRDTRSLFALATINERMGNHHEALGIALRARLFDPKPPRATLIVMRCYNQLGDHYAALGAFDGFGEENPAETELLVQRGIALAGIGQTREAIETMQRALARPAPSAEALRALIGLLALTHDASALQDLLARHGAAIRAHIECLLELGLERLQAGDVDGARQWLADAYALARRDALAAKALPWPVPEPLVRHEREQLELLARRDKLDAAAKSALDFLRRLNPPSSPVDQAYAPQGEDAARLEQALTAAHYIPPAVFSGRALGGNDYMAIEDAYFAARPSLVVIDNFLSPQALAALREYCEEASIWRMNNARGYTGALLAQGFHPPVLLGIAHELRMAMPRVIGEHALTQAWAFKYDQRMQGINMHADFAKVNVNFWITPDSACADNTTGGMVVYDLPAPPSWTFADYNLNQPKMMAYLKAHNAQSRRVPYRENRCVLFDSSLIHITDELHFKPGYENRRVNVTLLYGRARAMD